MSAPIHTVRNAEALAGAARFSRALDAAGSSLARERYYSVGGGFVVSEEEVERGGGFAGSNVAVALPFDSAAALLDAGRREGLSIAGVVLRNERAWREDEATREGLRRIWEAMSGCIRRGCAQRGDLPGGSGRSDPITFLVTDKEGLLEAMRKLDDQMVEKLDDIIQAQLGIGD